MKVIQIEKLNQLISRTDMTGSQKVEWLTNFIDEHVTEQLRLHIVSQQRELLLDFILKVNGNLIAHPHLQMNTDFVDEYIKSNNCG